MQATAIPTTPKEIRERIRSREITGYTSGMAPGHVQANLVVLPKDLAFDFLLFCQRNPKPCPLIEVVEAGSAEPRQTAPGADLRTDLPKYKVYEYGEMVAEPDDISDYWRDDMVSFLIGCSYSFEAALIRAGRWRPSISLPHFEKGTNVSMFITSTETTPAGRLLRTDGRLHAGHTRRQGHQSRAGHLALPRRPRGARPGRQPRGDRRFRPDRP